jgi:hypothetical protein
MAALDLAACVHRTNRDGDALTNLTGWWDTWNDANTKRGRRPPLSKLSKAISPDDCLLFFS